MIASNLFDKFENPEEPSSLFSSIAQGSIYGRCILDNLKNIISCNVMMSQKFCNILVT